ncbi:MAG: hypothetical protein ACJAWV_003954 [Flammeovirgaceae bacterium]|jgi:hypothetical protein
MIEQLQLISPSESALICGGILFLSALLSGIWKYVDTMKSPDHKVHRYIDTTHYASLFYAFASLLMAKFAELSVLSPTWNHVGVGLLAFYFIITILRYAQLGYTKTTKNQFSKRNFLTTTGMYLLIVGEIGGFLILFVGFLKGVFIS